MQRDASIEELRDRVVPLEMSSGDFREIGHQLVDDIADFLSSLPQRPVTPGKTAMEIRSVLGDATIPTSGTPPAQLLKEAAGLMFENSLFNGHPRFWGYITSSAAPIGALGDLLASAVNPNVGGWNLSPMASEIEAQTVRWIAELIGFPTHCGGLLVSGGNTANFVGFLAARRKKLGADIRTKGMGFSSGGQPRVYGSAGTHTWIEKAADQYGIGTDSIRWIKTRESQQMDLAALRKQIEQDKNNGDTPFLVVGTAGSVGFGAVDDLPEIAAICREHDLWFHVDGAYGSWAACLPAAHPELKGLSEADSAATDPHKWLYSPLEAGCALVRDPQDLLDTFSYHPTYYEFDYEGPAEQAAISYYEFGPQNSRGFRALKVWLGLRQVGREGYVRMISDDIRLSEHLYNAVKKDPNLEAYTQNLSITTFRYVPSDLTPGSAEIEEYLSRLNEELLTQLQDGGEAFISNAVMGEKYLLRACIVNFRSSLEDVETLPEIVTRVGSKVDAAIRSEHLAEPALGGSRRRRG
jgi:glutamate/tyrosine decarboxylase-like PLP-dependent enzyme